MRFQIIFPPFNTNAEIYKNHKNNFSYLLFIKLSIQNYKIDAFSWVKQTVNSICCNNTKTISTAKTKGKTCQIGAAR